MNSIMAVEPFLHEAFQGPSHGGFIHSNLILNNGVNSGVQPESWQFIADGFVKFANKAYPFGLVLG